MSRTFRVGIRTRLLLAVVGAVALALVIGVAAFNLLLDQRLTDSATSLARAQAEAELSTLAVSRGRLVAPRGARGRSEDRQPGLGVRRKRPRSRRPASHPPSQRSPGRSRTARSARSA